jgi:DNA-binding GntR family transcriptional regulator
LQRAILDGTLVAGERLHDEELIGWLGVSRTPIRTALERLTDLGLVEMEPNRFTRVAVPTRANLVQGLQVYAALIASAAKERIPNFDDVTLGEFRRRLAAFEAIGNQTEVRLWGREDLEAADRVFACFLRRSGNVLLLTLLHEVRMRLVFGFVNLGVPIETEAVCEFTTTLLAAVERRDEAATTRALTDYLGPRVIRLE